MTGSGELLRGARQRMCCRPSTERVTRSEVAEEHDLSLWNKELQDLRLHSTLSEQLKENFKKFLKPATEAQTLDLSFQEI